MNWWPCFICGTRAECPHREAALVIWMRSIALSADSAERDRYLRELERREPSPQGELVFAAGPSVQ